MDDTKCKAASGVCQADNKTCNKGFYYSYLCPGTDRCCVPCTLQYFYLHRFKTNFVKNIVNMTCVPYSTGYYKETEN